MRFIPLPPGTVRFVIIAIGLLLMWLVFGSYKIPGALWSPGDLSKSHSGIAACSSCHQVFRGATTDKCVSCHGEKHFTAQSKPHVAEFHRKVLRDGDVCTGCHTEHSGTLATNTFAVSLNPHGDFVFQATNAQSCGSCHGLSSKGLGSQLLDNPIVNQLMEEGEGAHKRGAMANCMGCHSQGRQDTDEGED